ncbi:MAG: hypothetical protein PHH77_03575 [Victivallaceae bacterium]|nr:hypothetical protein [Victivallaceae bacterium]
MAIVLLVLTLLLLLCLPAMARDVYIVLFTPMNDPRRIALKNRCRRKSC